MQTNEGDKENFTLLQVVFHEEKTCCVLDLFRNCILTTWLNNLQYHDGDCIQLDTYNLKCECIQTSTHNYIVNNCTQSPD